MKAPFGKWEKNEKIKITYEVDSKPPEDNPPAIFTRATFSHLHINDGSHPVPGAPFSSKTKTGTPPHYAKVYTLRGLG
ncbi:MAG: hypothetical protein KIH08_00645 [Candidatus Freyarchaeota archaeon]|nr:hypothetical protein [Candidatus Jordarchaeia archaeon]MBS7267829.1 hypothetical protein [Candidatus Jordarchaeia archaeon]MBS7281044.1 hypothetical protein [Candidatus Jordarchaeia archaeon]